MDKTHRHRLAQQIHAVQLDRVAQLVAGAGPRRAANLGQRRVGAEVDGRPAVFRPAAQHGQRRPSRPPALDEDDRDFVAHRQAVAGLEASPHLRYLIQRQRLRRDADVLDLVIRVVEQVVGRQDGGDLFGVEHGVVVQGAHRLAQQAVAAQQPVGVGGGVDVVVVFAAVGGQQVVEVQRQRRRGDLARSHTPRQVGVAPGGIDGDVVEKQVDLVTGRAVAGGGRRAGGHLRAGHVGVQLQVDQVAQRRRDGGDGQGVAHDLSPWRRRR